jgi:hypothetical protein
MQGHCHVKKQYYYRFIVSMLLIGLAVYVSNDSRCSAIDCIRGRLVAGEPLTGVALLTKLQQGQHARPTGCLSRLKQY